MTKLTLLAVAVLSAMPSGYRRAGFSLDKGENDLEATEDQIKLLSADENLTVVAEAQGQADVGTHIKSERILQANLKTLREENATLKNTAAELRSISFAQQKIIAAHEETISLLEIEVANLPKYTHEDTVADLAGVGDRTFGFDCSSAPEELHHFIAVIDDLNKETPLTKKPNCDHLQTTIEGETVVPTGAQRDAAWAWYEDNVTIVKADTSNAEAEA